MTEDGLIFRGIKVMPQGLIELDVSVQLIRTDDKIGPVPTPQRLDLDLIDVAVRDENRPAALGDLCRECRQIDRGLSGRR